MARVIISEEASTNLQEIFDYVSADSPEMAARLIDRIIEKIEQLQEFPRVGYRYESIASREVRMLVYGHYRIAYQITDNDLVTVLGVYHGARDVDRLLQDE